MIIDGFIVFVYLGVVLAIGLWTGRQVKNMEQFSVAGRSFSSMIVFATLSASFIGGGFSIGNAEKVFLFGVAHIVALWGFSLKELLVAAFIAPRMDRFDKVISIGDIMERDYGRIGKMITGVFSLCLCAGIVGAQVGGIGIVFHVFLDIPPMTGILIGAGIVVLYTTVGGMRAIVLTDIVQFVALGAAIPLTLYLSIRQAGGWEAVRAAVPATHFDVPGPGLGSLAFLSLFLTFVLGETLVPPYVQRLYIGKNASHTSRGTLLSGLFSIPFFAVTGLMGLVALTMNPELEAHLALPYVIKEVLPIGLKGLVIAGVISIVMSSADSFLNAAAIAVTHDILKPVAGDRLTEARELSITKFVTAATGLAAVFFAINISSVLDILLFAYNFWSPIILVPLTAVLLGVRGRLIGFISGAAAGMAGMLLWNTHLAARTSVDGLIIGVFCNMVVFSFVTTFHRHHEA